MAIPYCTVEKAKQIAKEYGGGTTSGEGKIWKTLNLDSSDILRMVRGEQIVNKFEGWDYRSAICKVKSPQEMKMSADVVKAE